MRGARCVALIVLSSVLLELVQTFTRTGTDRKDFAGELVLARPTWRRVMQLLSGDSTASGRRSSRNAGHYAAILKTDSSEEIKASISRDNYHAAIIGRYVVGRDGTIIFYKSRLAAEQEQR